MPIEIVGRVEGDKEVYRMLSRANTQTKSRAWTKLRAASLALLRRIKIEMPVDTGRARASWGQWTPGDIRKPNVKANQEDAVWEENMADLKITQGTNVRYVPALNDGHSQQAPAGFIDKAANDAAAELVKDIDEMLGSIFR